MSLALMAKKALAFYDFALHPQPLALTLQLDEFFPLAMFQRRCGSASGFDQASLPAPPRGVSDLQPQRHLVEFDLPLSRSNWVR
jgi:hypothetical protein